MNRKYWLETYGCQMNKAESEAIKIRLESYGWEPAERVEDADAVVLNTCSVRKTAENRIWGRLGYFTHLKTQRDLKIVFTGCMAERLARKFSQEPSGIDVLIGSFQKPRIAEAMEESCLHQSRVFLSDRKTIEFEKLHSVTGFRAFLPIMHGCDNYCSYCIVPYVRGPEVSRDRDSIYRELDLLDQRNVKDVTLLGQNVNSYSHTAQAAKIDFSDLLEDIAGRLSNIVWIRFLTSHPKDLSEKLIRVIRDNPPLCRQIHLPVQHGSNRILASMNRRYTREQYLRLIEKIRQMIPDMAVSTDILVGFPGEEEDDVSQTLDLMREVGFKDAYTYRYNSREGTAAFSLGDTVSEERKLTRLERVIALQRDITLKSRKKQIGRIIDVLAEGPAKKRDGELLGRTEWDEMVVFPGKREDIGELKRVEITSLNGRTLVGREAAG